MGVVHPTGFLHPEYKECLEAELGHLYHRWFSPETTLLFLEHFASRLAGCSSGSGNNGFLCISGVKLNISQYLQRCDRRRLAEVGAKHKNRFHCPSVWWAARCSLDILLASPGEPQMSWTLCLLS